MSSARRVYTEDEALGEPPGIRHPDMHAVRLQAALGHLQVGQRIFAYVLNQARNGDHYWCSRVTPSFDLAGHATGYHSSRRVPHADAPTR